METDGFPFQRNLCIDGLIEELSLTIGQLRIMCSFVVVGKEDDEPLYMCAEMTETFVPYLVIKSLFSDSIYLQKVPSRSCPWVARL